MVVRNDRSRKKYLGQRTRGAGNTKNRRGAGCRGGRGNAGRFKHAFSNTYMKDGAKITLKPSETIKAISVLRLNEYVDRLLINKKIKEADLEKGVELDFSVNPTFKKYNKVIGRKVEYKFILKNVKVTDMLKKAIEDKGGKI